MLLNGIKCVAIKEISNQTNEKQNFYFDVSRFNCKKHLSRVVRNQHFAYAKTKTQISFAVTSRLISVFDFAI